jgi:hypothetical protein
MTAISIGPFRPFAAALVILTLVTATALGQSQWAPSRSTTRPGATAATVPDWQRTPTASGRFEPVVRTSATASFHSPHSSAPIRSSSSASYRTSSSQGGNSARLAYDVPLGPGERLVGEPEMSAGRPLASPAYQTAHRGEVLPTPDDVSSHPEAPGEVIHEGLHDEHVEFDPQFGYEHDGGGYGCCDSCTQGGDCNSCFSSNRDPWAEPQCCPECGFYAYHCLGCNRAAMCLENCYGFIFRESSLFVGVQSFKGPPDLGVNGNFGFNEGFNVVGPLVPFPRIGVGYQLGGRWTQTNLSGNAFNSSSRNQMFFTGALFHRAYRNRGLQGGVAYDHLQDDYYRESNVGQLRYEFSLLNGCGHEIGVWGTVATNDDEDLEILQERLPGPELTDQANLFYRYSTPRGHQTRFWCGMTSFELITVGADMRVPVSNRIDFTGGFNYIIPDEGNQNNGERDESWNIGMNLVWYCGRRRDGIHVTPFRPLFDVADNGTMMFEPHP